MDGIRILYTIDIFGGINITETVVNMLIISAVISILGIYLSSNLQKIPGKKQIIAEKIVMFFYDAVRATMGNGYERFAPYIGTLFTLSIFYSLSSLLTFRPPTADINVTGAWALMTFFIIQYSAIKSLGVKKRLKSFCEPMPLLLPINLLGELSTPVSMAFRHFGNIFGGLIISTLLLDALESASNFIFGALQLPPILQVGLPGVLSLYFDLFTSGLQAYLFIMLTMVFTKMAAEE